MTAITTKNDFLRIKCTSEQKNRIINNAAMKGYGKGRLSEFVLTRLLEPDIPLHLLIQKIVKDIEELKKNKNEVVIVKNGRNSF